MSQYDEPEEGAAGSRSGDTESDASVPCFAVQHATVAGNDTPASRIEKERVWTALSVGVLSIPVTFVVSLAILACFWLRGERSLSINPDVLVKTLEDFSMTRTGLLVIILPGQMTFFLCAAIPALLSPQPFHRRLGMVRGDLPLSRWFIFALATPAVGLLSTILLRFLIVDPGPQLEMLERIFSHHASQFFGVMFLLVAVVPGFVEELLFRGYVQSRLLTRAPAAVAISISTFLFAIAHWDFAHALGVVPIGVWLGVVAWTSRSIFPAMICHMANNAFALFATQVNKDLGTEGHDVDAATLTVLVSSSLALIISIGLIVIHHRRQRMSKADSPGVAEEIQGAAETSI